MDKTEQNLNFNHANCLKHQSNFGSTTIYNICNNQQTVVPWGSVDWVVCFFLIAISLAFVALISGFAAMIWGD